MSIRTRGTNGIGEHAARLVNDIWLIGQPDATDVLENRSAVVGGASGGVERMIGTNWDVTEMRVLAEQLRVVAERDRATAAALGEQNRLMAMAERLSRVGHWRLDVKSGELFWSDELFRTFDLPTTLAPTLQNAIAAYHPDDRERVWAVVEHAKATGLAYQKFNAVTMPV